MSVNTTISSQVTNSDVPLKARMFSIHTTSICTLRCAKCGNAFPKYKKPMIANLKSVISALDRVFEIFAHIQELRFAGAEAFLYPDLTQMISAVSKYRKQFDYAIIITNGTYLPDKSIIEAIKGLPYPITVRVDNYGPLSSKYTEVVSFLRDAGIMVDERCYTGENQAFGGWLDLGDFEYKGYSEMEVRALFDRCKMPESGMFLCDNKLYDCVYAMSGEYLGTFCEKDRDSVDLSPETGKGIKELRAEIRAWRDEPFEACKYCLGYDPENGKRIPAAVQLPSIDE